MLEGYAFLKEKATGEEDIGLMRKQSYAPCKYFA